MLAFEVVYFDFFSEQVELKEFRPLEDSSDPQSSYYGLSDIY